MKPKRHAYKIDANHGTISRKLKARGVGVHSMAHVGNDFPDILTTYNNRTVLIEIKGPKGRVSVGQIAFMATFGGPAGFATVWEEAERLAKEPDRFAHNDDDRAALAAIVFRMEGEGEGEITIGRLRAEMKLRGKVN